MIATRERGLAVNDERAEALIVEAVHSSVGPCPILLWGSRATGDAEATSDYDLFVVLPTHRIPLAVRRLRELSRSLERRLGVGVALNPLPDWSLRHGDGKLSRWKLRREARVLAPPGFGLGTPPPLTVSDAIAFSYLQSAVIYLIHGLDPASDLTGVQLRSRIERGVRKALQHTAQLRLLRKGGYASRLEQVTAQLDDPVLSALAAATGQTDTWFAVRNEVLRDLPNGIGAGAGRTLLVNSQYCALAALAGKPKWRVGLTTQPIDRRLAASAQELLRAITPGGAIDKAKVNEAAQLLPAALRTDASDWATLRNTVVGEWPQAHPLVGL